MIDLDKEKIHGKPLEHLGLLAGVMKKVRLIESVDKFLPVSKNKGAHATMGERVAAMIYNSLGFVDSRLYMFPEFLSQKPVQRLFGSHLRAEHFTDDALGRCLDAIFEFGPTRLFSNLTFRIASQLKLLGKTVHIDTTSLKLYGQYNEPKDKANAPKVTYGFSKDGRPDLKQIVLNLATTTQAGLPVFMASHSGNASDQKVLMQAAQRIKELSKKLAETPSFIYVADSAMYESCLKEGSTLLWLSRVPLRRKEAKRFIKEREGYTWQSTGDTGYKIHVEEKEIAGVRQRWVLVFSKQAYDRGGKTVEKSKAREMVQAKKCLWHLSKQQYECPKDAEKALQRFQKGLKYHSVINHTIEPIRKHIKQGRPQNGAKKAILGYKINGNLTEDTEKITAILDTKGYFILATNQLDRDELSDGEVLSEYKGQQRTERGFAFIKDNTFEVSSVFLKKPSRIVALMMVMTLSLLIYALIQYQLRKSLVENGEYIPNQLKKPTRNPTAKWCFFLFRVNLIYIRSPGHTQELVINLTPLLERIVTFFGKEAASIYGINLPVAA